MRVQSETKSLWLLFLLSTPHISSALLSTRKAEAAAVAEPVLEAKDKGADEVVVKATGTVAAKSAKTSNNVGTKDAPVDGKDGRPHLGPFIETSAERDRKKAKEKGKDSASKKPPPKEMPSGAPVDTMPETNDGVMDDPNRKGPIEGTRGTEGGISEKNAGTSETKSEKKPDAPKEAPPLPHSEQTSIADKSTTKEETKKDKEKSLDPVAGEEKKKDESFKEPGGLEKPSDLPDKPHDIPHPVPASLPKTDPLAIFKPYAPNLPTLPAITSASILQPLHSFVLSLTMIIFSEIGDKTFLIAALMAMKHPRLVVFSAALTALLAMTILSAVLGHAVPTLIPKRFTNLLAAVLFFVFGAKMLREGYAIPPSQGVSQEMREVEMELEEKEELARKLGRRRSSISPYMLESGRKTRSQTRLPAPPDSPPASPDSRSPSPSMSSRGPLRGFLQGIHNLFSLLLSPAWVQTFIMTFLGEWGDRSQIATIAMAAGQDYWWVSGGAVSGHAICTAIAVIGGRAIAGKVSLRMVTLGGGFAFVAFGLIYTFEVVYYK